MTDMATPKEKMLDGFPEWEVKNAADTLRQAREIAAKPKLFKAAKKELVRQVSAAKKVLKWSDNL